MFTKTKRRCDIVANETATHQSGVDASNCMPPVCLQQ